MASAPLRAQLPNLTVRGLVAVRSKDKGPSSKETGLENQLNQLDVNYTIRNTDNGAVIGPKVTKTDINGEYSMTVNPGTLDIRVIHMVNEEINGKKFQVWFMGLLEGWQIIVKVSPNS